MTKCLDSLEKYTCKTKISRKAKNKLERRSGFRQERKKSTKINFLGPEATRWGRESSTRRGGGQKVRALPRKFVFLGFSKRGFWDVPGILPGCPGLLKVFKEFVQKKVSQATQPPLTPRQGSEYRGRVPDAKP